MLTITIPGRGRLELEYLVLDMNGTLALDGIALAGVSERLLSLRATLQPVVLTADTHGGAARMAAQLEIEVRTLGGGMDEAEEKRQAIEELGRDRVVAVGNGANDELMLRLAAIGVCVLGREGAAAETLIAADVVVTDVCDALDLLVHPRRLVATLRR